MNYVLLLCGMSKVVLAGVCVLACLKLATVLPLYRRGGTTIARVLRVSGYKQK